MDCCTYQWHCISWQSIEFKPLIMYTFGWLFVLLRLFEWIEGKHITHCTTTISQSFGAFARKIHNISSKFTSHIFPQESHIKGYNEFYNLLVAHANSSKLSPTTTALLKSYLDEIEHHIELAKTDSHEFIVQSDLNPLNILWNQREEIIGVVDFESITYTDKVEGLAWLIKWYSRMHGISSHEMSPSLAKSILQGYGTNELLSPNDLKRLPSLLWFRLSKLEFHLQDNGVHKEQGRCSFERTFNEVC